MRKVQVTEVREGWEPPAAHLVIDRPLALIIARPHTSMQIAGKKMINVLAFFALAPNFLELCCLEELAVHIQLCPRWAAREEREHTAFTAA